MKYAVIEYGGSSCDSILGCTLFEDRRKACTYLQWLWEDCVNEIVSSPFDELVEESTWHEDEKASVVWNCGDERLKIRMIKTNDPYEWFTDVIGDEWEQYAPN